MSNPKDYRPEGLRKGFSSSIFSYDDDVVPTRAPRQSAYVEMTKSFGSPYSAAAKPHLLPQHRLVLSKAAGYNDSPSSAMGQPPAPPANKLNPDDYTDTGDAYGPASYQQSLRDDYVGGKPQAADYSHITGEGSPAQQQRSAGWEAMRSDAKADLGIRHDVPSMDVALTTSDADYDAHDVQRAYGKNSTHSLQTGARVRPESGDYTDEGYPTIQGREKKPDFGLTQDMWGRMDPDNPTELSDNNRRLAHMQNQRVFDRGKSGLSKEDYNDVGGHTRRGVERQFDENDIVEDYGTGKQRSAWPAGHDPEGTAVINAAESSRLFGDLSNPVPQQRPSVQKSHSDPVSMSDYPGFDGWVIFNRR